MKIFRALPLMLSAAVTLAAQTQSQKPPTAPAEQKLPATPTATPDSVTTPNRADAYYHYSLAHIYEELVALYGRTEFANKAIDEYKLAIANDPQSDYLQAGLAELYAKTSRIRDAVLEAENILRRDPNNLDARKLLGRIYLRSLGDMQAGTQSTEILKRAIEQFEQIVRLEPKSVENHLLLGRLYILNKEMTKAEASFKTAVTLQPASEEAVTSLAYLYNEQGDPNRAARTLTAVPEASRSAKIFSALGYTYEQQHAYPKAVDAYRKAVELDRDNLDAMRGLAQNLLNDGKLEAALEQYELIMEADPQDAQTQLRIAETERRLGRLDAALASLKKAEALVQDSLEVPYNFALVYQAQGKFDEAAQTLTKLLERTARPDGNYSQSDANNRAVFLERLGLVYREAGRPMLAVEAFRKALNLGDENSTRAYQQIIDTYRDMKQWESATTTAQEAVQKYPRDRNLKLMYAGQLADTSQAEKGIELAKSLLAPGEVKENREIYIGLSQIFARLKRWPEAEEAAMKAEKVSESPDEKEYASFVQGSIFERQKKFELAEERFRQVLASDPRNANALNYLGYMLADRGVRLPEAVTLIRKALEIEPQNGAYLDSLGWAYFKQGKYDLAEENLRKAVNKVSNDATLHQHLGELYFKTGRLKLAVQHWERAIEEWNKSVASEVDQQEVASVQKKLEGARVRLAKQQRAEAKQ